MASDSDNSLLIERVSVSLVREFLKRKVEKNLLEIIYSINTEATVCLFSTINNLILA